MEWPKSVPNHFTRHFKVTDPAGVASKIQKSDNFEIKIKILSEKKTERFSKRLFF